MIKIALVPVPLLRPSHLELFNGGITEGRTCMLGAYFLFPPSFNAQLR